MGHPRLLRRGASVVRSGRLSCSIGAPQLFGRGASVVQSGRLSCFVGAHQSFNRGGSVVNLRRQRNEEVATRKKYSLFSSWFFLRPSPSFPILTVFLRQDRCQFPSPRLRVPPIHIVRYLPHRQPHLPCQVRRPHPCIPSPDDRPIRRFAKPSLAFHTLKKIFLFFLYIQNPHAVIIQNTHNFAIYVVNSRKNVQIILFFAIRCIGIGEKWLLLRWYQNRFYD